MTGRAWVVALIVALALVGLAGFARGHQHHRGLDVGTRVSGSRSFTSVVGAEV